MLHNYASGGEKVWLGVVDIADNPIFVFCVDEEYKIYIFVLSFSNMYPIGGYWELTVTVLNSFLEFKTRIF